VGAPAQLWRNYDGIEVDLLCETTEGFVAAEFKASERWDKRFSRGLQRMRTVPAATVFSAATELPSAGEMTRAINEG